MQLDIFEGREAAGPLFNHKGAAQAAPATETAFTKRVGIDSDEGRALIARAMAASGQPFEPIDDALPAKLFAKAEASYSGDTIGMKGTTRKPFTHAGFEWVNIGSDYRGGQKVLCCFRLAEDDGTAKPYKDHSFTEAHATGLGGYHGMAVKSGGKAMQLVGPERCFTLAGS